MPGNTNTIPQTPPPTPQGNASNQNGPGNYEQGYNKNPGFNPMGGTQGDQTGGKFAPAEAANYGQMYDQSQGMSGYFNGLASHYDQTAPQIGQVGQLTQMSDYYTNALNGNGPSVAQNQLQHATDQSIATQMAMANSTRGGAASRAGAQRAAMMGAGTQTAEAANQSAQIRAQEQQQAAQGLTAVGGLELQRTSQNASLQQANQQQIDQMQTALYGMGEQEQGLSLSEQQAYMANKLAAEGINTQQSQFNTQLGVNIGSAVAQGTAGVIGAAASDEGLKTDQHPEGTGVASTAGSSTPSISAPNLSGGNSLGAAYSHALNSGPQKIDPSHQDNAAAVGVGTGIGAGTGALTGAISGGPIGALVGGAGGALSGGFGAAAQSHPDDKNLKMENTGISAATGAAAGAAAGTAIYPGIGTAIGGIVGGVAGLVKGLVTSDATRKYEVRSQGLTSVDWGY